MSRAKRVFRARPSSKRFLAAVLSGSKRQLPPRVAVLCLFRAEMVELQHGWIFFTTVFARVRAPKALDQILSQLSSSDLSGLRLLYVLLASRREVGPKTIATPVLSNFPRVSVEGLDRAPPLDVFLGWAADAHRVDRHLVRAAKQLRQQEEATDDSGEREEVSASRGRISKGCCPGSAHAVMLFRPCEMRLSRA